MQVCITLEHRFMQTPDGRVWTVTQCPYAFFKPYLEVFSSVRVIARAFPVETVAVDFLEVEGPGVEFYAMPAYRGPYEFARNYLEARNRADAAVPADSAVLLRAPGQVANSIERSLTRRGQAYSVEVVADPYDVFSPQANKHPFAPIARRTFTRAMQRQCLNADAVCFVTKEYLQQRYPPAKHTGKSQQQYAVGLSDISLEANCFVEDPHVAPRVARELHVIFIGTLESLYKGPDVLIRAISLAKISGHHVTARLIGIGAKMESLKQLCRDLNVADRVVFAGAVQAGAAIRQELGDADVFVLPSRAEGVPRAMLEAMAQGLPCLGSDAGGIPELLSQEDLVPVNDIAALAGKLIDLAVSPERFLRSATRSLEKAQEYAAWKLLPKRREFYRNVLVRAKEHLTQVVRSTAA